MPGAGAQAIQESGTVDKRHPEIDDDRGGIVGLGQSKAFLGRVRHVHAVTAALQHQREPLREVHVVIDDQDGLVRLHLGGPDTRNAGTGRLLTPLHDSAPGR